MINGRKKRLSLCMVTKDDEKYLANCFSNLKGIVDEIIIVDIGSSDQTVTIAKQAGADVYQMNWNNNYSEARNICLNRAKGRWCLFLQANETISTEQLDLISPLLENPNVEGYLLYIDHRSENYCISSPVQSLRLLRNREEYRFQYRIFERIPDEQFSNIKDSGIRVVQQSDSTQLTEKYSLQMLLHEDLKEHPEDSYLLYMKGIELLNDQNYKESVEYFQRALNHINLGYLFAPHLFKCLTWALISLQRPYEALDVLNEGITHFLFYSDLLVLRGEIRKQSQQYGEAIQDFVSSLNIRAQSNSMVPRPEINSSVILEMLGEVHEEIFNYDNAISCYWEAYELNNTNLQLLYKIADLAYNLGSTKELEELLKGAIEKNQLEQLMIMMDILFQKREYRLVLNHIEYLEAVLGEGEQIESIKFSCYMMLGRTAEAELHFLAINKESPLYSLLLQQRIEGYWFQNEWQKAYQLIKELDQASKRIYHLLHGLLSREVVSYVRLMDQEYEIVSSLHENLLWIGQAEKAHILLPLLLQAQKEEQYLQLAEHWAERNDFQSIAMIFQCITNKQTQLQFKQKIIFQLLQHEHLITAQKLIDLGSSQPLGVLDAVLWSKSFIKKLEEWIAKVDRSIVKKSEATISIQYPEVKPSKDLLDFYQSLCNSNETIESQFSELTCAKIHEEIGQFFEKAQKKQEAIMAYLRALQWDPYNQIVQEKIINFADNFKDFFPFLEEKNWILEGNLFCSQEAFIYYIHGMIQIKKQQFEQAQAMFSKIAKNEATEYVAFPYRLSSLWLAGKETEANQQLDNQSKLVDIFLLPFFRICQGYALERLKEAQQQFPFSELIVAEKERIKNFRLFYQEL